MSFKYTDNLQGVIPDCKWSINVHITLCPEMHSFHSRWHWWQSLITCSVEGGQSGTYLRLTRASSGPRMSVAKTYRDENETKMNISAQTQRPSSAAEYKELGLQFLVFHCWGRPPCLGRNIHFRFVLISTCLSDAHPRAGRRSSAALSPFHIYLFVNI